MRHVEGQVPAEIKRGGSAKLWLVKAAALALGASALAAPPPARALDPTRSINQYKHTRWTRAEGAPAPIYAIAQTPDGFLWLASGEGLFRFDGLNFERIGENLPAEMADSRALLVTRNGDLWIASRSGRFAIYRAGKLRMVPAPIAPGYVVRLSQAHNGDVWAALGQIGQPMLRYRNGKWDQILPTEGLARDSFTGFASTADGAIWISFVDKTLRLAPGASRFQLVLDHPGARPGLALDRDGRVWARDNAGVRPLTGPNGSWTGRAASFSYPTSKVRRAAKVMFDRDGNLWVARRADGIERIRTPSPNGPTGAPEASSEYLAADGLTSDSVNFIFEDREGNIWAGTSLGLDRFRNANIAVEPALTRPAAFGDILFPATDGSVYIGQADSVYRVKPRGSPQVLMNATGEPEAICEGPGGAIWIVLADRIVTIAGEKRRRVERPAAETGIYACGLDRWGRMWMTAAGSGIYRKTAGGWDHTPANLEGQSFYPTQMVRDAAGDNWLAWGADRIARQTANGAVLIDIGPPAPLRTLFMMRPLKQGLILSGSGAIARLANGKLAFVDPARAPAMRAANGIVETPEGDTWSLGPQGLHRFKSSDLERVFSDGSFILPARTFGFADGLPDLYAQQSLRSLVRGGDGRLWAATFAGTVWIDPAHIASNAIAPPVKVASLTAGGRTHLDPSNVRLSPGDSSVTIRFAALSLGVPDKVQVRYRLEGQDADWIDPGVRRQAFYTNLEPGTYRFRAIAANEDGVWNREGSTLEFTIPPTFLQSIWFKLLLGVMVAALLGMAYLLRLRQVTARMQSRFDIRTAERERIARELHDTLLQGFQGLMLQIKAGVNRLPEPAMRVPLDAALERAKSVLVEGRDRVRDLRSEGSEGDLAQALLDRASDLIAGSTPHVRVTTEGATRELHPITREEIERIAEEAVRNTICHAKASSIDMLLIWGWRDLKLSIRDDGAGLPEEVLARGERKGHFGLRGMRERAERIGGRLTVTSRAGQGTEVSLVVPARAAYRDAGFGRLGWLNALLPNFGGQPRK